jgi:hypothetical protein
MSNRSKKGKKNRSKNTQRTDKSHTATQQQLLKGKGTLGTVLGRISLFWRVVIFLIGVPGLYTGILRVLPRISVTPDNSLLRNSPLSIPLHISNDGAFGIHSATVTCDIDWLKTSNHSAMSRTVANQAVNYQIGDLGPGESTTTFCATGTGFTGTITEAHITVHLSFVPEFGYWQTTRTVYLRAFIDDHQEFRWVLASN